MLIRNKMLLNLLFVITVINYFHSFMVTAYNPSCTSCKWFIPHKKENNDYGLCGFYKHTYPLLGSDITIYEFATHCRNNETMCGEKGYMYEPTDESYIRISRELKDKYEELENRCCGEVNETTELEQLEREMFEILQKIKKHNTRNIYRTTRDLYKLFKREA